MPHAREQPGFFDRLRFARVVVGLAMAQELQGDRAIEARVARMVDVRVRTAADLPDYRERTPTFGRLPVRRVNGGGLSGEGVMKRAVEDRDVRQAGVHRRNPL